MSIKNTTELDDSIKNIIATYEVQNDKKSNIFNEMIQNVLKNEFNITKETQIEEKIYDKIIEIFEETISSSNFDTTIIEKGVDFSTKIGKLTFILTTSHNQKNNIKDNLTTINLGECETLLRNYYNISNESEIFIKKLDIVQEGMKIPKIEYDIYSKLNGTNLIKLNISIC